MEPTSVTLIAMRAWSRAVRAYRAAVDTGTTAELDHLRRKVERTRARYDSMAASSRALVSPSFGKEDALSGCLRVVTVPAGVRAHAVCAPATAEHARLVLR